MSFNVEALFEKPTVDLSQVTTYMDIAEQRLAEIEAGEKEDYVIYRFFDYLNDPDGAWENPQTLTWVSLIKRAKAIGARLQQISDPGDRVVIMMPQNIDFVSAFVSCLYSGRIVVPAFSPTEPAHAGYLEAVLNDALPKVIITNVKVAREIRKFLKSVDVKQKPRVLAVEGVEDSMGQYWTRPEISPDDVAYLQYSSGSTPSPHRREDHPARCLAQRAPDYAQSGSASPHPCRQLDSDLPRHVPGLPFRPADHLRVPGYDGAGRHAAAALPLGALLGGY